MRGTFRRSRGQPPFEQARRLDHVVVDTDKDEILGSHWGPLVAIA